MLRLVLRIVRFNTAYSCRDSKQFTQMGKAGLLGLRMRKENEPWPSTYHIFVVCFSKICNAALRGESLDETMLG